MHQVATEAGLVKGPSLLREQTFRQLWLAQVISIFGDSVALFAITSVATFGLRAGPQAVTALQFFYLFPLCIWGIISGSYVDGWNPRTVMIVSDIARSALCLSLLGVHSIWGFYLILAMISSFSSFFIPAQTVLLRQSVAATSLRTANSLNQQAVMVMRIVGPPVAALLLEHSGSRSCYLIDALSFLVSAILLGFITPSPSSLPAESLSAITDHRSTRVNDSIFKGLNCIRSTLGLFVPVVMQSACMFVIGCFAPLMSVYVRDILHSHSELFGSASAMVGLGMLIATLLINSWYREKNEAALARTGTLFLGVATGLIACFPGPISLLVGCCMIGGGSALVLIPTQTQVQRIAPSVLLGTVSSAVMSLAFGAQLLGLFLGGFAAHIVGMRVTFGFCALILFLLMLLKKKSKSTLNTCELA